MRGPTTGPIRLNVETAPGDTRGRFRLSAYRDLTAVAATRRPPTRAVTRELPV